MIVISLIERPQPLAQLLDKYASQARQMTIRAGRRSLAWRESLSLLRQALTTAQTAENFALAAEVATVLAQVQLDRFNLEDAHQVAQEAVQNWRSLSNRPQLAIALNNLAIVNRYWGWGDSQSAQVYCLDGVQLTRDTDQHLLSGYLLSSLGATYSYQGQYQDAQQAFEQARTTFTASDSQNFASDQTTHQLGLAWYQHLYACEYAQDQGQFAEVITHLEKALIVLKERASSQIIIETLLTLAESYAGQNNLVRAHEWFKQAEELINSEKRHWHRPQLYLVKASLWLAEDNIKQARDALFASLGAIGPQADLRLLTTLYRMLATILERNRSRIDDARDALERAVAVGRVRARRLHLALALHQLGLHLSHFSNRPTLRAAGAGYLYEADRMLTKMGISQTGLES